ncbi:hypothetical protein Taro_020730 [Colocasia esculenta]|uniref:Uncharacterized protein n=1 Tax=Colocasia esculenta TaxID=4460 RepID=A0A843V0F8_COLES|nr:hypothetical protein [Colocasia esculenta]
MDPLHQEPDFNVLLARCLLVWCLICEDRHCFSFLRLYHGGRRLSVGMAVIRRGDKPNSIYRVIGLTVRPSIIAQPPRVLCAIGGLASELLRVPELVEVFPPRGILHLHDLLLLA